MQEDEKMDDAPDLSGQQVQGMLHPVCHQFLAKVGYRFLEGFDLSTLVCKDLTKVTHGGQDVTELQIFQTSIGPGEGFKRKHKRELTEFSHRGASYCRMLHCTCGATMGSAFPG